MSTKFENYQELTNGKGFRLPNGKVYLFDALGGWYDDEEKKYYNCNGEPSSPPKPEDLHQYEDNYDQDYEGDDLLKEYENGYDDGNEIYDEFFNYFKHQENHEKLEKSVLSYPIGTEISIEFFNMNFKANKRDLETFFLRDYPQSALNKNLIKSITIDMQELNPYYKKGTGRMITNNRDFALFCVKKNGEDLNGRPLSLDVENYLGSYEIEGEVKIIKETPNLPKENQQEVTPEVNTLAKEIKPMNAPKIDSKEFKPTSEVKEEKKVELVEEKKVKVIEEKNFKAVEEKKQIEISKITTNKNKDAEIEKKVDSDDPWSKPIAKQVIKNQTPPVQSSTIKPQTNAINIASKTTSASSQNTRKPMATGNSKK